LWRLRAQSTVLRPFWWCCGKLADINIKMTGNYWRWPACTWYHIRFLFVWKAMGRANACPRCVSAHDQLSCLWRITRKKQNSQECNLSIRDKFISFPPKAFQLSTCKLCLQFSGLRMRNCTWNRFPIKEFADRFLVYTHRRKRRGKHILE